MPTTIYEKHGGLRLVVDTKLLTLVFDLSKSLQKMLSNNHLLHQTKGASS